MGGTIILNPVLSPEKKERWWEKTLDVISAPLSKPKVTFTKGIRAGGRAVKKSRKKIRRGDTGEAFKVIGTTVLSTATATGIVLGVGVPGAAAKAIPMLKTAGLTAAKAIGKSAVQHPIKTLFISGLVTTTGGRMLLKEIPKKTVKAGEIIGDIAGKVLGEEEGGIDLTALEAIGAGGLIAGAGVGGYQLWKMWQGRGKKDKPVDLPGKPLDNGAPFIPAPVGAPGSPALVEEPVVSEEKPIEEKKIAQPMIKITNKPEINIAIAQ